MEWLQVSLTIEREVAEAVAEVMRRYTSDGVALDLGQNRQGDRVTVHAYLKVDELLEERRRSLDEALGHLDQICPLPHPRYAIVNEESWKKAWQETLDVLHVGEHFVIRPPWRRYTSARAELVLTIDPDLAFGTGLHPSTRLCLEALEQYGESPMRVLDLGTGTGVLALAAAKLGAATVLAVDHDAAAVATARKNVQRNGVAAQVQVLHGSLADVTGEYDLILANLLNSILLRMAQEEDLATRLRPGGRLVASGILQDQVEPLVAAFKSTGLHLIAQPQYKDWVALVAQRLN